ncbi:hypothetical protein CRX51_21565 [Pluralibacter gergoviae]|nr:hypothetical protein CRX51_21565 [Pluralibacter gergoviae]
MNEITPNCRASLADKNQKTAIKIFYVANFNTPTIFTNGQGIWATDSYPLFLWITLCIRVRKPVTGERRRGLRLNWCETRLFIFIKIYQCVG